MSDSMDTVNLHRCVERWQQGDRAAADELLNAVGKRLELLTRKLLRGYPIVRGWAETGDVFQNSLMRLLQSLNRVRPESTRHFYNLAALHIRRELIDLARRCRNRQMNEPAGVGFTDDSSSTEKGPIATAASPGSEDFELWSRFHEAVDALPPEEREVISLTFYHGWTQAKIADLFQVDVRTVRRRWQSACSHLQKLVGELPRPS